MSKFKLTQTAAEVQDILNNSLQKPTGLAKTKLVGVGVNGQENIEIGDNLTLANGKLSAAGGGSFPSTITFDGDGNRKVGKNLGVDGKLTLKSLVSASNPDGDITKALGGKLYRHKIKIYSTQINGQAIATIYTSTEAEFTKESFSAYIEYGSIAASGLFQYNGEYATVLSLSGDRLSLALFSPSLNTTVNLYIDDGTYVFRDKVDPVK